MMSNCTGIHARVSSGAREPTSDDIRRGFIFN